MVVFTAKAESRLNDLVHVLYKKEYFGFMDSCINYARNLRAFAQSIPQQKIGFAKMPDMAVGIAAASPIATPLGTLHSILMKSTILYATC